MALESVLELTMGLGAASLVGLCLDSKLELCQWAMFQSEKLRATLNKLLK